MTDATLGLLTSIQSEFQLDNLPNIRNENIKMLESKRLNAYLRLKSSAMNPIKIGVSTFTTMMKDVKYEFSVFRSDSLDVLEMTISADG